MDTAALAKEWIEAQTLQRDKGAPQRSIEVVMMYSRHNRYSELWDFVRAAYPIKMKDATRASLAAGPLEDLLAGAGSQYIEEVEELSRKDPKFRRLLGGLWQNSMSDDTWNRVCRARGESW